MRYEMVEGKMITQKEITTERKTGVEGMRKEGQRVRKIKRNINRMK